MRRVATVVLAALVLASVGVAPASAQSIEISVTQNDSNIVINVLRGGEPLENASVTVRSVIGNSTALDGEYTTDSEGEVIFRSERTRELSGVVHLRIDVRKNGSYKSVLSTITRSPDFKKSAPLGQRISMSLQENVASTRGTIEGSIFVTRVESVDTDANKVEVLSDHATQVLAELSDNEIQRQAFGRRLATGGLSPPVYYARMIRNAGETKRLRHDLLETVKRLNRFSASTLRDNNVDPTAVYDLYRSLEDGEGIDTNTSILIEDVDE